jgi:hypothetical protein
MTELKEKALAKMLEEMNIPHSQSEDLIHNWLCEQDDEELMSGILMEGKTIKGSYEVMMKVALDGIKVKTGHVGYGFSPDEGFQIVSNYFKDKEIKQSGSVVTFPKNEINNTNVTTEDDKLTHEEERLLIWAKEEKLRRAKEKEDKLTKKAEQEAKKAKQSPDVFVDMFSFGVIIDSKNDPANIDPSDVAIKEMADQPDPDYGDVFGDEDNEINE